jgi:hypothetical protein
MVAGPTSFSSWFGPGMRWMARASRPRCKRGPSILFVLCIYVANQIISLRPPWRAYVIQVDLEFWILSSRAKYMLI